MVLPLVLKSQLVDIVEQQTNSKLTVESVYFNPFIFKLQLDGVELYDCGFEHLASFKSLEINLEPHSLLNSALHVKSIIIDKPEISIIYNKDKTFNFTTLLKEEETTSEGAQEDTQLPRVIIDIVKINDGKIDYKDFTNTKLFEFEISSMNFKLQDIDTNDFKSSGATLRFYSDLGDGGSVDFRSKVIGFKPFTVEGSVKFEASKLYTQWKYMQDKLGIEVANGSLSFGGDYYLNVDDLNATLLNNVYLNLNDLRLKPKNETYDILNLQSLNISGVTIKPVMQDVHVQTAVLTSLDAKVKRDSNGNIDWTRYLKGEKKSSKEIKTEKTKKDAPPWNVLVDSIVLNRIGVEVQDKSVTPPVNTKLNQLNIDLKDVTLAGDKPFSYNMNLVLNDSLKCSSIGNVKHRELEVNTYLTCQGFDIVHYKPYIDQMASKELKTYNIALKGATASFDVNATLKDENSQINTVVKNANFTIDKFVLNTKESNEKLADFNSFNIKGLSLNTKTKEVEVAQAALSTLGLYIKKDKKGTINFNALVEAKVSKKEESSTKKVGKTTEEEKPYSVKLKHFNLDSAKIDFSDNSLKSSTKTEIDRISLNAYDIDSKEKSWLDYELSLRVNKGGVVSSKGSVRHTPLKQKGTLSIKRVSLKEFTPYIQESMFLNINDGYVNVNSKLEYSKDAKQPDLLVKGGLEIEEFQLNDSRDNSVLVAFSKTDLKSFRFAMFPSSLYIDEINLDAFYLDAKIDENKQMNLAKLSKIKEDENATKIVKSNSSAAEKDEKFVYKIMKLHVSNGAADFADFSLPIKFKTSMHDLNGNVYAISNSKGEISYVDIDGEVDEYGSARLKGSIESSNIKSFTDIDFNFKNLSLDSFSGYSAQFAGYKINKGKLFLDLGYKISDSELLGKNSVVIKNIELGDEVEDENITKLPLGFAIALLEDSDGVIDINMPVNGNLDKPDFKYGALVLKTFGNLIVKAVASPFNFLGAILGINGDELKYAEFEASEFLLLPPQREKLDNIAKILVKKPKLSLGIIGGYDKIKDKKAIQSKKLTSLVLQKSGGKGVVTLNILEKIYSESAGKESVQTLKTELEKKYEKIEIFKAQYQKELFSRCAEFQSVSLEELKDLSDKRAKTVQEYLVLTKNIEPARVFTHEVQEIKAVDDIWVKTVLKIEVNRRQ